MAATKVESTPCVMKHVVDELNLRKCASVEVASGLAMLVELIGAYL